LTENHYGYGLRNDEKPFAHKIPPGGNWKALPEDEQRAFMKGAYGSGGGQTGFLKRMSWDGPALSIIASVMGKANCALHPGVNDYEGDEKMYDVTPQQPNNGLTVAEFFAGGGLMAVGLKTAGYNIVWANDFDPEKNAKKEQPQVTTYKHNIGDHIVQKDVMTLALDEIPNTDVIAGGPPCQDFSVAGAGAGEDGEKGKLVWTYLNIIKGKQPKAFIFENVKGLIQKKHKHTFDALLEQFDAAGYNVTWQLISAWDYGVAQKRERVFIVGIRKDLGFSFKFPQPAAEDCRTQVLRDVIGDLPEPFENHEPKPLTVKNLAFIERNVGFMKKHPMPTMDEPNLTVTANYRKGAPLGCFYPKNHNEKSFWTPPGEYTYGQANRVQDMDGPSNTIPAHHNSGQPQHPTQAPRRFTVRECLRIQSVPDWYVIPETIGLGAQYKIVGNGVASRVAWYLGKALAEQLHAVTEARQAEKEAAAGNQFSF